MGSNWLVNGLDNGLGWAKNELEDAYNSAAGNPKGQKAAYDQAGGSYQQLGSDVQNQYGNLNDLAQSYFSGTTGQVKQKQSDARLNYLQQKQSKSNLTQGEFNELTSLQQQAIKNGYTPNKTTGQWDAPSAPPGAPPDAGGSNGGPISPDQALINQTNNRSTQQQSYLDYMKGQAGGQTNQEQFYGGIKDNYSAPTNQENLYNGVSGSLSDPTNDEAYWNSIKGGASDLTNQETLYNERKNGTDPAAAYQDQRAIAALDNAAAARGGYNSGASLRSNSDYYANIGAQRSQQLAALAGGADTSRLSKTTAYSGIANTADASRNAKLSTYGGLASGADASRIAKGNFYQGAAGGADTSRATVNTQLGNASAGASKENSDYYSGITDQSTKLAAAKAGISQDILTKGIEAYQSGQVASIDAYLAKAGVDAKAIAAFNQTLQSGGKVVGELAA